MNCFGVRKNCDGEDEDCTAGYLTIGTSTFQKLGGPFVWSLSTSGVQGHVEAQSAERGRDLGRGIPHTKDGGPGVSPPGKFWNLGCNSVQSGVFWQEIDGPLVFTFVNKKHCHNARQLYWRPTILIF